MELSDRSAEARSGAALHRLYVQGPELEEEVPLHVAGVSCVVISRQEDADGSLVPAVRTVRHTAVCSREAVWYDTRLVTLVQFVERSHHDGRG
jgi:hypothetical protein